MELTDQELLDLAIEGDGSAFEVLFRRYEPPLRGFFRTRRVRDEDAGDLLQETFARVYRYAASYDPAKRLGSWIFTIASNLFKDARRKGNRRDSLVSVLEPEVLAETQAGEVSPETEVLRRETEGEFADALGQLSESHRAVFMLKHYYGLRYHEIGRLLGISVGTVKSRMHYSVKALRHGMQKQQAGPTRSREENS